MSKTIRTKLLCNCKHGKMGDVVEMKQDVFDAYGKGYVETSKEDLMKKENIKKSNEEKDIKGKETKEVKADVVVKK